MSEMMKRHPGTTGLLRWLEPNPRLLGDGYAIAAACHDLAVLMVDQLPDGPELTAGLRKLLEAKDCFVRAGLESGSVDNRPHSRACGVMTHEHGASCAPDCPTCSPSAPHTGRNS
jgi:hypothetical protein